MNTIQMLDKLNKLAPFKMAEKWDNPGLLVGENKEIKKILVAVDASDYVIDAAIEAKADLIITHHPLIFTGLKNVTEGDFIGRRVLKLAKNNIALIAMHTNYDICQLTDAVSERLGLKPEGIIEIVDNDIRNVQLSDEAGNDEAGIANGAKDGAVTAGNDNNTAGTNRSEKDEAVICNNISEIGYGCYGRLENATTVSDVARLVKERFELNSVRVFGSLNREIKLVGIFQGSGKSAIDEAVSKNIDALITGDIDHHAGIDAVAKGIAIIDAGHYGIEKIFVDYMSEYLAKNFENIEIIGIDDDEPFVNV